MSNWWERLLRMILPQQIVQAPQALCSFSQFDYSMMIIKIPNMMACEESCFLIVEMSCHLIHFQVWSDWRVWVWGIMACVKPVWERGSGTDNKLKSYWLLLALCILQGFSPDGGTAALRRYTARSAVDGDELLADGDERLSVPRLTELTTVPPYPLDRR